MSDLISRKEAFKIAKQHHDFFKHATVPTDKARRDELLDVMCWLTEIPGVELIHCKDCEWWTKQDKSLQGRCELMQMYPTGEWYCGNAQKRVKNETRNVKG